jgi:hypothetical protein
MASKIRLIANWSRRSYNFKRRLSKCGIRESPVKLNYKYQPNRWKKALTIKVWLIWRILEWLMDLMQNLYPQFKRQAGLVQKLHWEQKWEIWTGINCKKESKIWETRTRILRKNSIIDDYFKFNIDKKINFVGTINNLVCKLPLND